ncbi:hypothetical protein Sliba_08300 [Streptomyces nigrescens]|nr:hypothetical protein Sliba_08300 [Streptomyces libani subsp. libani]GGV86807.1 hypothetical protein GCM10010500_05740 [Streptomyces libani subsp. libani]
MNGLAFHLPDRELLREADELLRMVSDLHKATDREDLVRRTEAGRHALSAFIQAAATKVR